MGKSESDIGVVLLSGGMDSCVTTAIAAQTRRLALVHASYGQRTEQRERQAFEEIADFYRVPPEMRLVTRLEHFEQIGGSALTDSRIQVPEREIAGGGEGAVETKFGRETRNSKFENRQEIPVTYVPFRNAHFLSVGVSWAEALGATAVYIGAVSEDSSGYPDCRPEYYQVFQELVRAGTRPETQIIVNTPVIGMRKHEIVRLGIKLGAPLHLTWSCYQFEDAACGACESCRLRLRAFAEAGVEDPVAYRVKV